MVSLESNFEKYPYLGVFIKGKRKEKKSSTFAAGDLIITNPPILVTITPKISGNDGNISTAVDLNSLADVVLRHPNLHVTRNKRAGYGNRVDPVLYSELAGDSSYKPGCLQHFNHKLDTV
ncbi:hypothetical protein NC651_024284 [Populus alba x Populus x berolinensis]|nr:hypothetical protein NC651_024284 [Populus alba x Populus x berolinensis]